MITKDSLEKGYQAALEGRPLDEVTAIYTNRPVRVIKRQDREKSAADYQRDHEIALLKLLAKKHPDIAADLATTTAK